MMSRATQRMYYNVSGRVRKAAYYIPDKMLNKEVSYGTDGEIVHEELKHLKRT